MGREEMGRKGRGHEGLGQERLGMSMTRVKICGLTREGDVDAAVSAGADALGFVFAPGSKRVLESSQAARLVRRVPAFVSRVGLFLNQDAEQVARVLDQVALNLLQFHGTEDGDYCRQFGMPYIKAVSAQAGHDLGQSELEYDDAAGLLLDSHPAGGLGGTGRVLDWTRIKPGKLRLILAGGLDAANVGQAIRLLQPWAVDVSSGVEDRPGIKNADAMREFIKEAKREY
jgi:phosphoribosylanthranilate isomerase